MARSRKSRSKSPKRRRRASSKPMKCPYGSYKATYRFKDSSGKKRSRSACRKKSYWMVLLKGIANYKKRMGSKAKMMDYRDSLKTSVLPEFKAAHPRGPPSDRRAFDWILMNIGANFFAGVKARVGSPVAGVSGVGLASTPMSPATPAPRPTPSISRVLNA